MKAKMDNSVVFNRDQVGFSEAYYVLWNDPTQKFSMIVRFVLFNGPTDEYKLAEVWGWFRDRSESGIADLAIRQRYSLDKAVYENGVYSLKIGDSGIDANRCWGKISNGASTLSWDFDISDPNAIGINRFPGMDANTFLPKFYSPACKMKISGSVQVDEQSFTIENLNGSDGHYWNVHNLATWNWCNGVTFQNDPDFLFEGIAARFNDWGQASTWLHFAWQGKHYSTDIVNAYCHNRELSSDLTSWEFSAEREAVRFEGKVTAKPEDMILIIHPLPDGSSLYTHISYNADLTITISEKDISGEWRQVKTVEAIDTAAFEVTKPERNPKVRREFEVVPIP